MKILRTIAAWTLPLTLLAYLDIAQVHPHDFWWHVKTGEVIARTGAVPQTELFSYAREGQRWVNEPWLMQLLLHGLYESGGLALVIFTHALFVTAGYSLLWWVARKRHGRAAAAVATLLGALIGMLNWGVRPQGASFLFFGATVALLTIDRESARESERRGRSLWLLVPIFALWVNCHGGFTFGLLALGTYAACRVALDRAELRRLAPLVLAVLVACCLTPVGPRGIVEHVGAFFESGAHGPANLEFEPLTIRMVDGMFFFYAVGRLLYPLLRGRPLPKIDEALPLLVFAIAALAIARAAPWFGMMLVPVLARALSSETEEAPPSARAPLVGALLAVAVVATFPFFRRKLPIPPALRSYVSDDTPIAETKWVCANVPEGERLFSVQAHTSFVEWACPRVGVLVDTRIQAFSGEVWDDYFAVANARFDWEDILAKYKVRYVMLPLEHKTTIKAIASSPRWKEIHRDDSAVVFGPAAP